MRELENITERLFILCDGDVVHLEDLPMKILAEVGDIAELPLPKAAPAMTEIRSGGFAWPKIADLQQQNMGLKEFFDIMEEKLLSEALGMCGGVKNQAAEILGIKRTTLIEKLKKRNMDTLAQ